MELLGSINQVVDQDKDGENVPKLASVQVVLVHCILVNNNYQQAYYLHLRYYLHLH